MHDLGLKYSMRRIQLYPVVCNIVYIRDEPVNVVVSVDTGSEFSNNASTTGIRFFF